MEVIIIAQTKVKHDAVQNMLDYLNASDWRPSHHIDGDDSALLVELAGRVCYQSWGTETNANLTRVRTNSLEYLENLRGQAHDSVLEHVSYTFALLDVSRVMTHELVTHRVGIAKSQESQRFVRIEDRFVVVPDNTSETICAIIRAKQERDKDDYMSILKAYALDRGMPYDKLPFSEKKEITSLARRIMPQGVATHIIWTANVRSLRDIIMKRISPGAEWEIRKVFSTIRDMMIEESPALFGDLKN